MTRGDVDLAPIVEAIPLDDVVVWNNADRPHDLRAYGRYKVMPEAANDLVYVQDDDVIVHDIPALVAAWEPGNVVVNRGHAGSADVPWVGWGAVFDRGMPSRYHESYLDFWPRDDLFLDFCDAIFTMRAPVVSVQVPFTDLPWFDAPSRTASQPDYYSRRRPEAIRRIRGLP